MKKFLLSIERSITGALAKNEYVVRWERAHPRASAFLRKRWSLTKPYGLFFSAGIAASIYFFLEFLSVAQDVIFHGALWEADARFANLVPVLRSFTAARFFLFMTYLGNWQIAAGIAAIVLTVLLLLRKQWKGIYLAAGLIGTTALYNAFKLAFHRVRPDTVFALVHEGSYAFPSGHAAIAVVLYGFIAYVLCMWFRRWWERAFIALCSATLILLIGFSRIYLGAHWITDVLGGWFLGLAVLTLVVSLLSQKERVAPERAGTPYAPKKLTALAGIALFLLEALFVKYYYLEHPLIVQPVAPQQKIVVIRSDANLDDFIRTNQFPKYSESLSGNAMEPMNFIVIGSEDSLKKAFLAAGWTTAEMLNFKSLFRLGVAALFGKPYPNAPVTPSFLHAQPEVIAFQKQTGPTLKQRHHVRFWKTDFRIDGKSIFVGAASFDRQLKYFVTHKIDPDIDTEREFIKNALGGTGLIEDVRRFQLVKPQIGQNLSADQFFTDGEAYIIYMR